MVDRQGSGRPDNAALEAFLRDLDAEAGGKSFSRSITAMRGDSLIAAATFQVLRKAGLRCRLLDHRYRGQRTEGAVVLYSGGGNLVPLYGERGASSPRITAGRAGWSCCRTRSRATRICSARSAPMST